jgi:hypothetical protein
VIDRRKEELRGRRGGKKMEGRRGAH